MLKYNACLWVRVGFHFFFFATCMLIGAIGAYVTQMQWNWVLGQEAWFWAEAAEAKRKERKILGWTARGYTRKDKKKEAKRKEWNICVQGEEWRREQTRSVLRSRGRDAFGVLELHNGENGRKELKGSEGQKGEVVHGGLLLSSTFIFASFSSYFHHDFSQSFSYDR